MSDEKRDWFAMNMSTNEIYDYANGLKATATRRLELLRRVQPYLSDYLHIFDGDSIEDLNMLADLFDDIEKELKDESFIDT